MITMQVQLSDDGFQAVFRITNAKLQSWTLSPEHLRASNMDEALREATKRVSDLQRRYA